MNRDARKLMGIYLRLKEDEGDLLEMEFKHPHHNKFKDIILDVVDKLDSIAHLLVVEATEIKDDKNGGNNHE